MALRQVSINMTDHPPAARHRLRRHRGFTLIEAAYVTVIVGVACAALMQLLAAGTVANAESAQLTTAVNLAHNVHEATLPMSYMDVVFLNNKTYSPPVDSRLKPIPELGSNWKQQVSVSFVDPSNIGTASGASAQPTARVTVTVSHRNSVVYTTRWVTAYVP